MKRRGILKAACVVPLFHGDWARAENFPSRPLRLVVPFAAGSSPDNSMRALALSLGEQLGQTVIVENKPGANGISGTIAGLGAPADGYTMVQFNVGTIAINPYLYPQQRYDPVDDLRPLALTSATPNVLVVRDGLGVESVAGLIACGKRARPELVMGSSGTGTTGHLSGELFKQMTGMPALHVPYKGSGAVYVDLGAGRVDFMFDNLISVAPHLKDGRVKLLAVTSAGRNPLYPDTPTLQEAGLKGYDTGAWGGIAVPRGTPAPIAERLAAALDRAQHSKIMQDYRAQSGGQIPSPPPGNDLPAYFRSEQKKWSALIKRSGATRD